MKGSKKEEQSKKSRNLFLLVFLSVAIACSGFALLCFWRAEAAIAQGYLPWFCAGGVAALALGAGVFVWASAQGRQTLCKSLFSIYLLLLFCLTLCYLLQTTGFFRVVKTPEKLEAYLERAGFWMPFFYILLQFLQVVVLPIPGIVSTLAGLAIFGAFWTMVYSLIGILLGSVVAFWIGRKLGYRAVSWILGEESLRKWQKKLKGKDGLVLTLMFLLPLFPDDILCFLSGLSSMSTGYFLTVITVSRIIAVGATCYSFDFIPFNTWWGIALWCVFLVGIVFLFVFLYKNLDKLQKKWQAWKGKKKRIK